MIEPQKQPPPQPPPRVRDGGALFGHVALDDSTATNSPPAIHPLLGTTLISNNNKNKNPTALKAIEQQQQQQPVVDPWFTFSNVSYPFVDVKTDNELFDEAWERLTNATDEAARVAFNGRRPEPVVLIDIDSSEYFLWQASALALGLRKHHHSKIVFVIHMKKQHHRRWNDIFHTVERWWTSHRVAFWFSIDYAHIDGGWYGPYNRIFGLMELFRYVTAHCDRREHHLSIFEEDNDPSSDLSNSTLGTLHPNGYRRALEHYRSVVSARINSTELLDQLDSLNSLHGVERICSAFVDAPHAIVLDSDMVVLRSMVNLTVQRSRPIGASVSDMKVQTHQRMLRKYCRAPPDAVQNVAIPVVMHLQDLESMLRRWLEISFDLRHESNATIFDRDKWTIEMYGYAVAAAEIDTVHLNLTILQGAPPYYNAEAGTPFLLHYSFRQAFGPSKSQPQWSFDKRYFLNRFVHTFSSSRQSLSTHPPTHQPRFSCSIPQPRPWPPVPKVAVSVFNPAYALGSRILMQELNELLVEAYGQEPALLHERKEHLYDQFVRDYLEEYRNRTRAKPR